MRKRECPVGNLELSGEKMFLWDAKQSLMKKVGVAERKEVIVERIEALFGIKPEVADTPKYVMCWKNAFGDRKEVLCELKNVLAGREEDLGRYRLSQRFHLKLLPSSVRFSDILAIGN